MPLKIPLSRLIQLTKQFTFSNEGDLYEKEHESLAFHNCEEFWKKIVTPITNRITNIGEYIRARENVTEDLQEIAAYHYSIFLNIVYANDCLKEKQIAYFENFYAHLSTACDLVEDLLLKIYLLISECKGDHMPYSEELNEAEFQELASKYFKEDYQQDYEHYFSKGKYKSISLIKSVNILEKQFNGYKDWDEYLKLTKKIRTYRNIVIHNKQLAYWKMDDKEWVPQTNHISKYKTWNSVFLATEVIRKKEFIERKELMKQTLIDFNACLDKLWIKPLNDLETLLYIEKNPKLLAKYDLQFIDDSLFIDPVTPHEVINYTPISGSTSVSKTSSSSPSSASYGSSGTAGLKHN